MSNLETLTARLRTTTEHADMVETLELPSSISSGQAINLLAEYFGTHEESQAAYLVIDDQESGYLLRSDLYDLTSLLFKGIGESGYGALPGQPQYRLIELCCPVLNCSEKLYVMRVPEQPRYCKVHLDSVMEIAK